MNFCVDLVWKSICIKKLVRAVTRLSSNIKSNVIYFFRPNTNYITKLLTESTVNYAQSNGMLYTFEKMRKNQQIKSEIIS